MELLVDAAVNGIVAADGSVVKFKGLTLDLECLDGSTVRELYSDFVVELRSKMPKDSELLVCVHPARSDGRGYFSGYDFKVLGEHSDGLIVMAHDYYTKALSNEAKAAGQVNTPPAPIYEVYYALKAATDPQTGTDREKVWLAISFDSVQWQLTDGSVNHTYPYHPTYSAIAARLPDATVTHGDSGNPKAVWTTEGVDNVLFYEDTYSVLQKLRLARAFDIAGLSLWRLGTVPDFNADVELDVWQQLTAKR